MSKLTRDGTAELVLRDQILRRERGQEKNIFPVELTTTSRTSYHTRLIHTLLKVLTILINPHGDLCKLFVKQDNGGLLPPI